MRKLIVAAAQFENASGRKDRNFARIRALTKKAVDLGAHVVSFHEGCVTGYTFVRKLSRAKLLSLAEFVPGGRSVRKLIGIAGEYGVHLLAGLLEKDKEGRIYNTYICVNLHLVTIL